MTGLVQLLSYREHALLSIPKSFAREGESQSRDTEREKNYEKGGQSVLYRRG